MHKAVGDLPIVVITFHNNKCKTWSFQMCLEYLPKNFNKSYFTRNTQ